MNFVRSVKSKENTHHLPFLGDKLGGYRSFLAVLRERYKLFACSSKVLKTGFKRHFRE
jgi:hypothetical protein